MQWVNEAQTLGGAERDCGNEERGVTHNCELSFSKDYIICHLLYIVLANRYGGYFECFVRLLLARTYQQEASV